MSDEAIFSDERLARLLPAVYRVRDGRPLPPHYRARTPGDGSEGPLAGLVAVLAEQARVLEADLERQHDNWFIETCEEWVVPYIGALLGVRSLQDIDDPRVRSARALVANTLAHRRRKGTATMLEQLALDLTGWPTRAVEFFERIATTQGLNHLRPHVTTADLRDASALELVDGPFDRAMHLPGVGRLPVGRHAITHVGLFAWRLESWPYERVQAEAVTTRPGLFTFDPLGRSLPLVNRRRVEGDVAHLAEESDVPCFLRRRALHDELEARRQALTDGMPVATAYFESASDPSREPVLRIHADGVPVPAEAIVIANLEELPGAAPEDWQRPPDVVGAFPIRVAVDPELGRLAFRDDDVPASVEVSFCHAFPGEIGGGPYDRRPRRRERDEADAFPSNDLRDFAPTAAATRNVPSPAFPDLASALAGLAVVAGDVVVVIGDGRTHAMPAAIDLGPGDVVIAAANERRPVLVGSTVITGAGASRLALDGLLLHGDVRVEGAMRVLAIDHCTITPPHRLDVAASGSGLEVRLRRTVTGPVATSDACARLTIEDAVVDAAGGGAIDAPATDLDVAQVTVFGTVTARSLEASNSIVTGSVRIERCQEGCVRFSWLAPDSRTPRRFRCQPDLALEGVPTGEQAAMRARVVPAFTTELHGQPAYAQLASTCPPEIRRGADDGSEMGAWSFLEQPQREANLAAALGEYLRVGLDAALIHVT